MCGDYFNLKAAKTEEPTPVPVTAYHVHIYFDAASEKTALETARKIDELFPGAVEDAHRVGKVGPHTLNNIGVTITPESFGEIVSWLQMNRKDLSILVHPRTGDEWRDHMDCALWLGKPVDLNMKFLNHFKPGAPKGPAGPAM
jgi:aromatic ring-cleaving dioxygenase